MQEVQDLQHVRRELHDQVEHWRYRAQETMEQKAADVMRTDSRNQGSPTATEEILLDIKKLQEVYVFNRSFPPSCLLSRDESEAVCALTFCLCAERGVLEAAGQHFKERIRRGRK